MVIKTSARQELYIFPHQRTSKRYLTMSFDTNELFYEISRLPAIAKIKTSYHYSSRSGAAVGLATMISGLVAGPVGLIIGGIVSSCAAGYFTWNKFESIPDVIINDTTPEQKEKLAKELRKCINSRSITNVHDFILSLQNDEVLMQTVMQILITFITVELKRSVVL